MDLPPLCLIFFFCCCYCFSSASAKLLSAPDRFTPGEAVSVNQTVVSAGGIFALGFFSGKSSRQLYAGIWYHNIPKRTVVWVANRETPLLDASGGLAIAGDGNIAVLDGERRVLWSSNASGVPANATAVLRDDGNLVLATRDAGVVWQSFDHPADTILPGMKLVSGFASGVFTRYTAWRGADDPSPGRFSMGFDPARYLQILVWRGSEVTMRSQVWSGALLDTTRLIGTPSLYVVTYQTSSRWLNLSFSATAGLPPLRSVLDRTGSIRELFWNDTAKDWVLSYQFPEEGRPCHLYNQCGAFGVCNYTSPSLACSCLPGYRPRDPAAWGGGNFSAGCERQTPLACGGARDGFRRTGGWKLPDKFTLLQNASTAEQCRDACLGLCSCVAYAYVQERDWAAGFACLLWDGELVDLSCLESNGHDMFLRQPAPELAAGKRSSNGAAVALLVTLPAVASVMLLMGAGYLLLKRRSKRREGRRRRRSSPIVLGGLNVPGAAASREDIGDLRFLPFGSIVSATDNFSAENKLGEGGFGPVYKGRLPEGQFVAVKRLSEGSGQGSEEFKNEVELIARLQHTNLVNLVAWCIHEDEKLLIYEYLPNKSLDQFIFDPAKSAELDWHKRMKIVEGIAQGLLYLHRYSRLRVVHRDLKTGNILLDGAMNPKISDFGLARRFGGEQTEARTRKIVGTIGYMSPEYALNGVFSEKSDVFSFGVIILEVVSGRRSTGFYLYDESPSLLGHAWTVWQEERVLELVEPAIRSTVREADALRLIQLGLLCTQENPTDRPSMSSIVSVLDNRHIFLPSPKKPSFTAGKVATKFTAGSSSSDAYSRSHNDLTITRMQGR